MVKGSCGGTKRGRKGVADKAGTGQGAEAGERRGAEAETGRVGKYLARFADEVVDDVHVQLQLHSYAHTHAHTAVKQQRQ